MRLSAIAALMILTTFLLSACTQDSSNCKHVEDHSQEFYGPNTMMSSATAQTLNR